VVGLYVSVWLRIYLLWSAQPAAVGCVLGPRAPPPLVSMSIGMQAVLPCLIRVGLENGLGCTMFCMFLYTVLHRLTAGLLGTGGVRRPGLFAAPLTANSGVCRCVTRRRQVCRGRRPLYMTGMLGSVRASVCLCIGSQASVCKTVWCSGGRQLLRAAGWRWGWNESV
jgi:hypothetical protein